MRRQRSETYLSFRALFLLMVIGLGCGCTLLNLRKETAAMHTATVLVGFVQTAQPVSAPIRVAAATVRDDGTWTVSHHTRLHAPGGYELIVPAGKHVVFAFIDRNDNLRYDSGEEAAWTDLAAPLHASGDGVISGLDLVLGSTPLPSELARAKITATAFPAHSTQAGAVIAIDDSVFSLSQGERGYWAPLSFYRELGGNVYFTEPYDPRRIPVLFIHGAAGTPQNWHYILSRLDRSRYQAWFFYYPSGSSIESMSHLLFWKLMNLQARHGFTRMYLTAHSMGGLVARDFLSRHAAQLPVSFPVFVTFATPWGGDSWADVGVQRSPATIPSWIDMQPAGPFLRDLFAPPLPPGTSYHLFFGHLGSPGFFRPNNDGAVTLESQLRPEAQREAKMTYGFNEDHTGILYSNSAFERYAAVLDAATGLNTPLVPQGSLQLHLLGEAGQRITPPQAMLILDRLDDPAGRLMLSAIPDGEPALGPLPAGRYSARVFAYGYATDSLSREVAITAGETAVMDFQLRPQGVLQGYVAADRDPAQRRFPGYRQTPHSTLRISRVILTGKDVHRVLEPATAPGQEPLDLYLNGTDFIYGAGFSFVGLPAGDYQIRIESEGHAPYVSHHTVTPGRYEPIRAITLTRE